MKRVRCPKCDNYITFDETQYEDGQSLVFECPECRKQFAIRIGKSKLKAPQKEERPDEAEGAYGSIVVVENVFHYKQVLPLQLGENVIGRYVKGTSISLPIETNDPSMDTKHCIIHGFQLNQPQLWHHMMENHLIYFLSNSFCCFYI